MTSNNQDKVILITGTSQGIGQGIAKHYLKQGWTVIGVNRNPEKTPKLEGNIITLKADQSSLTDFHDVVKELKTKHNITQIDIVVANSGTGGPGALLKDASPTDLDYVYQVNTRGPLVLYQTTRPLLKDNGTFVVISSLAGSLQRTFMWELIGFYGASKAAVNYLTRTIHFEEPTLKAFTIDPGSVDTKSAREAWDAFGKPPVEASAVDDVIPGIVKVINDSTKEETSGWMWNPHGSKADF